MRLFSLLMYSLFIFLIAFILFSFEIIVSLIFWKPLDPNILIVTCVMILPWIFTLIQRDTIRYHTLFQGSLINKIFKRKQLYFFLNLIEIYSLVIVAISLLYLILFFLLQDRSWMNYSIITAIFFLITAICQNIIHQLFTHS